MSAGAVIALAVITAGAVTLGLLVILRVLWRRAVKQDAARLGDDAIAMTRLPGRPPVTDEEISRYIGEWGKQHGGGHG